RESSARPSGAPAASRSSTRSVACTPADDSRRASTALRDSVSAAVVMLPRIEASQPPVENPVPYSGSILDRASGPWHEPPSPRHTDPQAERRGRRREEYGSRDKEGDRAVQAVGGGPDREQPDRRARGW